MIILKPIIDTEFITISSSNMLGFPDLVHVVCSFFCGDILSIEFQRAVGCISNGVRSKVDLVQAGFGK